MPADILAFFLPGSTFKLQQTFQRQILINLYSRVACSKSNVWIALLKKYNRLTDPGTIHKESNYSWKGLLLNGPGIKRGGRDEKKKKEDRSPLGK